MTEISPWARAALGPENVRRLRRCRVPSYVGAASPHGPYHAKDGLDRRVTHRDVRVAVNTIAGEELVR